MKPDELFNVSALAAAVAAVTDVSVPQWVWVLLAGALIVVVIVAVRRAEYQDPTLEEMRSDFAQLLPKDPAVNIERRKETS